MKTTLTCATITYVAWAAFPNFGAVVNALALPIFVGCLLILAAIGIVLALFGNEEMPAPKPCAWDDCGADPVVAVWLMRDELERGDAVQRITGEAS